MKLKYLGICGLLSLLSYTAMVLFSPLAYPNYNWITSAVSELTAENAPSLMLANQLNCLFVPCGTVSVMAVCVGATKSKSKVFKIGIYLFCAMMWLTACGYTMFPYVNGQGMDNFQNLMHLIVTILVVALSISSLIVIFIGTRFDKNQTILGILSLVTLGFMIIGAIGSNSFKSVFGIFERISMFSVVIYNAILGLWLFVGNFELRIKESQ